MVNINVFNTNTFKDLTCSITLLFTFTAGVMAVPFQLTDVDRHETHFQVNYLSHFLLINLLLPNMIEAASDRKAPIGRIVNVSAAAMYYGKLDLDDLESRY